MTPLFAQINLTSDTLSTLSQDDIVIEEKTLSILELVSSGGAGGNIIMITLAILSIISVYLLIERFSALKKASKEEPVAF